MKWFKISSLSLIIKENPEQADIDGEGIYFPFTGKYFYTIYDTLIDECIKDDNGYNLMFNTKSKAQDFINKVKFDKEIKENSKAIQEIQEKIKRCNDNDIKDIQQKFLNMAIQDRHKIYRNINNRQ